MNASPERRPFPGAGKWNIFLLISNMKIRLSARIYIYERAHPEKRIYIFSHFRDQFIYIRYLYKTLTCWSPIGDVAIFFFLLSLFFIFDQKATQDCQSLFHGWQTSSDMKINRLKSFESVAFPKETHALEHSSDLFSGYWHGQINNKNSEQIEPVADWKIFETAMRVFVFSKWKNNIYAV